MVYLRKQGSMQGLGRVTIDFYDAHHRLVASTLSESDGFFTYLGLHPGEYTAKPDADQMEKLGFSVTPESVTFTIHEDEDGDYVEGLEFTLQKP